MDEILERVSRDTKKGKLTVDDDKEEIDVQTSTYWKIYSKRGGWKTLIPLISLVAGFSRVEQAKIETINKWANYDQETQ